MKSIKVLIVDDSGGVRQVLSSKLCAVEHIKTLGEISGVITQKLSG
jgi:hypothetical protein